MFNKIGISVWIETLANYYARSRDLFGRLGQWHINRVAIEYCL
jgi:hypothetical protein